MAQEEIGNIHQKNGENLSEFGSRFKKALQKLNIATTSLTSDQNALKLLREANEKLAIRKFKQNISNTNIRIMVDAAQPKSLDEAIVLAEQKMQLEKPTNANKKLTCNFCKMEGHFEKNCFKKRNSQMNQKPNFNSNNNFRNEKPKNTPFHNPNDEKRNGNDKKYNYNNQNQNRNIRTLEDDMDKVQLNTLLNSTNSSKN